MFDALLPLLTPAARAMVHSVIRTPGATPYSRLGKPCYGILAGLLGSWLERPETRAVDAVNALLLLDDVVADSSIPLPISPTVAPLVAAVAAVGKDQRVLSKNLCSTHARWGKKAFKCLAPSSCKMRNIIMPKPSPPSSGNGRAGGQ